MILFLSMLVILPGCDTAGGAAAQAGSANPAAPVPEVGIIQVEPRAITLDTELSGRTAAYMTAEVRPQVSGIILERAYKEGSEVNAGQLLYRIDPASYQAAYDSAKATQARDEAVLTTAELKVKRYRELVKINAVSQEDYDDAAAALKQAQATLAIDKAAVETARINLAYTRVTAPISGRIGRSAVTQGALVTAGQSTALATIRQFDPIYVDVTQSSSELLRFKRSLSGGQVQTGEVPDTSVQLILDDGIGYVHRGRLQFSEVNVDESTGSVTLRAEFPNPDLQLLPGMYVRALLTGGVRPQAMLVPQQAVTRDAKGKASALVLGLEDKVESRELILERAIGNQWLVASGLQAGDRLIVDGLQKVHEGMQAKAVQLTSAESHPAGPQN